MRKNRLQKIITGLYASPVAHMATGFSSLNKLADSRPYPISGFFCVRKPTHTRIMAGRNGGAFALAGFPICQSANPVTSRHPV